MKLPATIVLKTQQAEVVLTVTRVFRDTGHISFQHEVRFSSLPQIQLPVGTKWSLGRIDLRALITYLRNHIGPNAAHELGRSSVFVPLELDFSLQALSGTIDSWESGHFRIRWMAYVGAPERGKDSLYIGFESNLDVAEACRWIQQLEELASLIGA